MQFNPFIPRFDQHLTFPCDSRKLSCKWGIARLTARGCHHDVHQTLHSNLQEIVLSLCQEWRIANWNLGVKGLHCSPLF